MRGLSNPVLAKSPSRAWLAQGMHSRGVTLLTLCLSPLAIHAASVVSVAFPGALSAALQ